MFLEVFRTEKCEKVMEKGQKLSELLFRPNRSCFSPTSDMGGGDLDVPLTDWYSAYIQ